MLVATTGNLDVFEFQSGMLGRASLVDSIVSRFTHDLQTQAIDSDTFEVVPLLELFERLPIETSEWTGPSELSDLEVVQDLAGYVNREILIPYGRIISLNLMNNGSFNSFYASINIGSVKEHSGYAETSVLSAEMKIGGAPQGFLGFQFGNLALLDPEGCMRDAAAMYDQINSNQFRCTRGTGLIRDIVRDGRINRKDFIRLFGYDWYLEEEICHAQDWLFENRPNRNVPHESARVVPSFIRTDAPVCSLVRESNADSMVTLAMNELSGQLKKIIVMMDRAEQGGRPDHASMIAMYFWLNLGNIADWGSQGAGHYLAAKWLETELQELGFGSYSDVAATTFETWDQPLNAGREVIKTLYERNVIPYEKRNLPA